MTENETVALGEQARGLLENPVFMGSVQGLMHMHLQNLLATEDNDVRGREQSFRQMRAYETILADLQSHVTAAEKILAEREADSDEDYTGDI